MGDDAYYIEPTQMDTVVLDRFSGGDPMGWVSRAERYFMFLGFSEKYWLSLPYYYLEGDALAWFDWLYRNKQFYDWKHFKEKLFLRFQKQPLSDSIRSPRCGYFSHVNPVTVATHDSRFDYLSRISNFYEGDYAFEPVKRHAFTALSHGATSFQMADLSSVTAVYSKIASPSLETFQDFETSEVGDSNAGQPNEYTYATVEDKVFAEISQSSKTGLPCHTGINDESHLIPLEAAGIITSIEIEKLSFFENSSEECKDILSTTVSLDIEKATVMDLDILSHTEANLTVERAKLPDGVKLNHTLTLNEHITRFLELKKGNMMAICIWDPEISSILINMNGYTESIEMKLLLGSTSKFCLFVYNDLMTKVWDPGQQWCVTYYILQCALALEFASSLYVTSFCVVERDISPHLTKLARDNILLGRTELLVLLLALYVENDGMEGARSHSVTSLYLTCVFTTFSCEPENVDLSEKANLDGYLHQEDMDTVGERVRSQPIGWHTSTFSLQQGVRLLNQLYGVKLNNIVTIAGALSHFPFDPSGNMNLLFHSKQKRSATRFSMKSFLLLYSNLEDKVLVEAGGIVMNGFGLVLAKQPNTKFNGYVWNLG